MLTPMAADLHLHTVLSPCAEYLMVPRLLIEQAVLKGLDVVAVTDHNSGENAAAVVAAAEGSGVQVLPGMEVESREGVHILTLFDNLEALERWQLIVYAALPEMENNERLFGAQLVVDAEGRLLRVNRRLLITAIDLSLEEVIARAQQLGGLCVPSHVDRPANGLLGVLGLVPEGLGAAALELSPLHTPEEARTLFPALAGRTLIRSSDAHSLAEVGKVSTVFLVATPSVAEIALACRGEEGREVAASAPTRGSL